MIVLAPWKVLNLTCPCTKDVHIIDVFFQDCLSGNVDTVYDLIASHGDIEDMVFFAMLMKGALTISPSILAQLKGLVTV